MESNLLYPMLHKIWQNMPEAYAVLSGAAAYPGLMGFVEFYEFCGGSIVAVEVKGLPRGTGDCPPSIFGFHIHEGASCTGNEEDPFADTGSHYNPEGCPHPEHKGDLPPIFSSGGVGASIFYTNRFSPEEVIGSTMIIHSMPDDFTSQPSGNSGVKIACGEIMPGSE